MNSATKNASNTAAEEGGSSKGAPMLPSISLPKGGGAIHGMGEKFATNPVTGTGAMTVPIATSPGRGGGGPPRPPPYTSCSRERRYCVCCERSLFPPPRQNAQGVLP